jgi:hypothetical protein
MQWIVSSDIDVPKLYQRPHPSEEEEEGKKNSPNE